MKICLHRRKKRIPTILLYSCSAFSLPYPIRVYIYIKRETKDLFLTFFGRQERAETGGDRYFSWDIKRDRPSLSILTMRHFIALSELGAGKRKRKELISKLVRNGRMESIVVVAVSFFFPPPYIPENSGIQLTPSGQGSHGRTRNPITRFAVTPS